MADRWAAKVDRQMTLDEVLEAVRDHYLTKYREAIGSYRQRFTPSGPEALLETGGDRPLVYRYYRMDLASGAVDPPNFTEVNPQTHLEFEELRFNQGGLTIRLSPIVWNGVEFRVEPQIKDDAPVRAWALRWIDPEERAEADSDGLGAYVHSVTMPVDESESTSLSVDFGSAPTASVLELLGALREAGATAVDIHSRTVLDK